MTDVAAETANGGGAGSGTTVYLRGAGLIAAKAGSTYTYYDKNAHGDVYRLLNAGGAATTAYVYDAFGVQRSPSLTGSTDTNPFRYCGEYFDAETGSIYLRARYYAPGIGRFTQEDTHWNSGNMLYGDDPVKVAGNIYAPNSQAIAQSGNLYVYCTSNPVLYRDKGGNWEELAWEFVDWLSPYIDEAWAKLGEYFEALGAFLSSGSAQIMVIVSIQGGDAVGSWINSVSDPIKHKYVPNTNPVQQWAERASGGGETGNPNPGDPGWGNGFKTFRELKKYLGSPGQGNQWHHIVEQSQIRKSGFASTAVNNTNNVVSISNKLHIQISAYYNTSTYAFTNGLKVRDWLAGQSFQFQYQFGLNVIKNIETLRKIAPNIMDR